MKRLFITFFVGIICLGYAHSQDTLVLQGKYCGKNLYVLNPGTINAFCVQKVLVNNQPTKDELNSNSFEIDFSMLNIALGANVSIIIYHKSGCKPKVVNREVLFAQSNFSFVLVKQEKFNKLSWTIKGDVNNKFVVEQFRWQKWITVGEVYVSADSAKKTSFSCEIKPHSLQNTYRVSHTDAKGNVTYSKLLKFSNPSVKEVLLQSQKVTDNIIFSAETTYEIFDEKGTFISDGVGIQLSIANFPKGKYWVNFDNKTLMVTKK